MRTYALRVLVVVAVWVEMLGRYTTEDRKVLQDRLLGPLPHWDGRDLSPYVQRGGQMVNQPLYVTLPTP